MAQTTPICSGPNDRGNNRQKRFNDVPRDSCKSWDFGCRNKQRQLPLKGEENLGSQITPGPSQTHSRPEFSSMHRELTERLVNFVPRLLNVKVVHRLAECANTTHRLHLSRSEWRTEKSRRWHPQLRLWSSRFVLNWLELSVTFFRGFGSLPTLNLCF